jgi:hypothetical protein
MEPTGNTYEEIDNLQMLLAIYVEHEDTVLAKLIMQIQQTLEGLKACA